VPEYDGGLFLELVPTAALRLPSAGTELESGRGFARMSPRDMIRVVSRQWLVADIDTVLRTLERNLGWEAVAPPAFVGDKECLRAKLHISHPNGATIEFVQPTLSSGRVADDLIRWGPGPYYTQIAVVSAEAKAEDLALHGIAYELLSRRDTDEPRVRILPGEIQDALIEFVEQPDDAP
jgi:hypothetical protein